VYQSTIAGEHTEDSRVSPTGRDPCYVRAVPDAPAIDPLAVVEASPALVLRKDLEGWLSIYTDDALIEDPVGAERYRGKARIEAFWRVFIAPQERIVFHARRNFVARDRVVRQVSIETVTPVSPEPVTVEAIIEYRLRGPLIASMRAFWQVRDPVAWHFTQGAAGLVGLARHGGRLIGGLGLGAALAFGRAMVPKVSQRTAEALLEPLGTAPREAWRQALAAASVRAVGIGGRSDVIDDLAGLWTALRGDGSVRRPEAITVGGNEVAAILTGDGPDVAVIAKITGGRIVQLSLVGG
jgi:hypothetical protein